MTVGVDRARPVIAPPATIGVLGGGQLGRYAIMAARVAGYGTIVLDPDPRAPAGRVADRHLVAAFDDPGALDALAAACSVVTTEFENPPAAAMERLAAHVLVRPSPATVAIAQDRIAEKSFLTAHGFLTVPSVALAGSADLEAARLLGVPSIVKTARLGYDGKGQRTVDDVDGIEPAWRALGAVPCIVERLVPLDVELSAIVARSPTGDTVSYPIAENRHRNGILDLTIVPARVDTDLAADAAALGRAVAEAFDYIGVLAVEMFVSGGRLLVNELAPRPHNSGHWTLDAARTDQFAQQVRAITGAALGDPALTVPAAAMVNLLGDLWLPPGGTDPVEPDWPVALAEPGARLHLYGKAAPRPGRKMGHVTLVADGVDVAVERAIELRDQLARRH